LDGYTVCTVLKSLSMWKVQIKHGNPTRARVCVWSSCPGVSSTEERKKKRERFKMK